MKRLYVEGSMSLQTGDAAWSAICVDEAGEPWRAAAAVHITPAHAVGVMELRGIEEALRKAVAHRAINLDDEVTIVLRSTATLAVLMWILDAPCAGELTIHRPKKMPADVANSYSARHILEDVDRLGLKISLEHISTDEWSRQASNDAKAVRKQAA